jgi:coproporphyrinogen III oxidase
MRERAKATVEALQDAICAALEETDGSGRFVEDLWQRPAGGGGRTRVLEGGDLFEKAAVNTSAVWGDLPEALGGALGGAGVPFYATGISLILHPHSPHIPTTHANFRYIERGGAAWFGGGADLTPYVLYEQDASHFHNVLAAACDRHDATFYPRFKRWCDEYFFLPHRGEARGVGGLFFDDLGRDDGHDLEALYPWWRALGEAWLPAYLPIVQRHRWTRWDAALKRWQLQRRGRYVEFNLLHDRGTLFGLKTGGRLESIFASMPPLVRWDYDVRPEPDSPADALLQVLRNPRDWRTV